MASTYGAFLEPDALEPWVRGDEVDRYFAGKWPNGLVAARGDEILAVAVVDGNLIDLLWVREDARGQAVGSALMDRIEADLAAEHEHAELECFAPNTKSVEFYEGRGYAIVRRYDDEASGVEKVVMRRSLAP
ncbi:MAG: GNAT family N-acetyltransferase [Planctomycetota bacterium]